MSDANLTDISALAKWDTSNVTDLNRAFNVNQALTSLHGIVVRWLPLALLIVILCVLLFLLDKRV